MAYSNWRDSFWHTAPNTGAEHIDGSKLFVHGRKGGQHTFTFKELFELARKDGLTVEWLTSVLPNGAEIRVQWLQELLRYIHIFLEDMQRYVYRYSGYKNPVIGLTGDFNGKRTDDQKEEEPGAIASTRHL